MTRAQNVEAGIRSLTYWLNEYFLAAKDRISLIKYLESRNVDLEAPLDERMFEHYYNAWIINKRDTNGKKEKQQI